MTLGTVDEEPIHTVTISGVTITHGSGQTGGGISVLGANLDLQFSVVSSNKSSANGGGIDIEIPAGTGSKITNCLIVHNSAASLGGGVRVGGEAVAQIVNSTISRNSAGLRGGFTDVVISLNQAGGNGGGLFGGGPKLTLAGTTVIVGNHPNDCSESGCP